MTASAKATAVRRSATREGGRPRPTAQSPELTTDNRQTENREPKTTEMSITVIGSLNVDYVVRVPRFPQPGETLSGERFETFAGGKGANQACAAARLGCPGAPRRAGG